MVRTLEQALAQISRLPDADQESIGRKWGIVQSVGCVERSETHHANCITLLQAVKWRMMLTAKRF
jgi:hypothetical protein